MYRLSFLLLALLATCLLGCSQQTGPSNPTPVSDNAMSNQISEADAKELAQQFVAKEWSSDPDSHDYALEFESIRLHAGEYQVRYTKKFREPTKASPPYRLVVVRPDRTVTWGMP
jgi:hypothetical protein